MMFSRKGLNIATLASILALPYTAHAADQSIASFDTVQEPNIDYGSFNDKLSVLGNFNSISFYEYVGQSELSSSTSQNSLYLINDQSQYKALYQYNGTITTLHKLGDDAVLLIGDEDLHIGDNYTSPVIFNTTSEEFQELQGWSDSVTGDIMSVYYDSDSGLIYFGGDLTYNDDVYGLVIYDAQAEEIVDSPFRGFNEDSTVNAIIKIVDYSDDKAGSIIFGGSFNNLGDKNLLAHKFSNSTVISHNSTSNSSNTSISVDPENVVSLKYATISSVNTDSSTSDDASLIICPDNEATWLINDQNVGSWTASLPFEVYPSKVRLYNSIKDDTGVQYFRVITSPTNGIMNMTYIDPTTQKLSYCDAWCPLQNITYLESLMNELDASYYSVNSTLTTGTIGFASKYQEFDFVNSVQVSSITIQVMSSYGTQAGLSGFQLYQSGIVTYANDSLNEPNCGQSDEDASTTDLNGGASWSTYSDQDGTYLTTTLDTSSFSSSDGQIGVTFYPNVTYSGDYTVLLYTPGCSYDNTCSERGIVNVTLVNGNSQYLTSSLIYQNNEAEKYDTIYTGHLDVEDGVPYVDMFLSSPGSDSDQTVLVADRIELNLLSVDQTYYYNEINSTTTKNSIENLQISINGLFEYSLANFSSFDNSITKVSTNGTTNVYVGNSTINLIGSEILSEDASVNGLAVVNNTLYIAGEFESEYGDNFIAVSLATYNETSNSTTVKEEKVVDGGVNGIVDQIYLYDNNTLILVGEFTGTDNSTTINKLNTTESNTSIDGIALYNGSWYSFADNSSDQIVSFTNLTFGGIEYFVFNGDNSSVSVWDNTNGYWVSDSNVNVSAAVKFDSYTLATGRLSSVGLSEAKGGAYISDPHLASLPFEVSGDTYEFYTALYLNDSVSVYGGQFNTSDGYQNLVFVNSDDDNSTYGIDGIVWDSDSKVVKLLNTDGKLFIGMENGATVNDNEIEGLVIYQLSNTSLSAASVQPASLSNDDGTVRVNSLVASSDSLYVGGAFNTAGSLTCQSICSYDLSALRWSNPLPSTTMSGTVYQMVFYSTSDILVSGNLTIDGSATKFAIFNTDKSTIVADSELSEGMDATIKSFILVDESVSKRIIAMGDQYLGYYNGSAWTEITQDLDLDQTTFKNIQLMNLNSSDSDNDGDIFGSKQILMVSGSISHETYGNFSTGFYNGTSWIPYLFTESGTGANVALQNKAASSSTSSYSLTEKVMKVRNVVGVGFACALGSLLLVVAGYCAYYFLVGSKNAYARPMEARVAEKDMLQTVPPTELIDSLDHAKYIAE